MHAFAFSSCYKKKIGKKAYCGRATALLLLLAVYISVQPSAAWCQCSAVSLGPWYTGAAGTDSGSVAGTPSVGAASPSEGSRVAAVPVLCLIQPGLSRHSVWRGRGHQPAAGLCNVVLFQTCYTYHDVWHTQAVISYIHFDEERGVLISDSFRAKCHRKVMHVN